MVEVQVELNWTDYVLTATGIIVGETLTIDTNGFHGISDLSEPIGDSDSPPTLQFLSLDD